MAMETTQLAATVLSGLNGLLLVVLVSVWFRNYRTFGSRLTLGLVAFALALLVENALAVYFFFSAEALYGMSSTVQTAVVAMRAFQFLALAFLTYVSLD
jgi:hypothetical protein